jgi:CDP-glucose 4,6-dehydratase
LVISSYWRSFFSPQLDNLGIAVAPVRGGNVIGGGDWAKDRIIPDTIRALSQEKEVLIRNRHATRPWQHVLELLSGYLHLGTLLYLRREAFFNANLNEKKQAEESLQKLCSPFNFGPFLPSNKSVGTLVEEIFKHWPGKTVDKTIQHAPEESSKLNLTIDKAYHTLGWQPKWGFEETIQQTVEWYREFYEIAQSNPEAVRNLTKKQIRAYSKGLSYTIKK